MIEYLCLYRIIFEIFVQSATYRRLLTILHVVYNTIMNL